MNLRPSHLLLPTESQCTQCRGSLNQQQEEKLVPDCGSHGKCSATGSVEKEEEEEVEEVEASLSHEWNKKGQQ